MKNSLLCASLFSLLWGCGNNASFKNYTVTRCLEVADGYQYSPGCFWFQSKKYRPLTTCAYSKGILESLRVYRSEGSVFYSKADLTADPLLLEQYDLVSEAIGESKGGVFYQDHQSYRIALQNEKSIFCTAAKRLLVVAPTLPQTR